MKKNKFVGYFEITNLAEGTPHDSSLDGQCLYASLAKADLITQIVEDFNSDSDLFRWDDPNRDKKAWAYLCKQGYRAVELSVKPVRQPSGVITL